MSTVEITVTEIKSEDGTVIGRSYGSAMSEADIDVVRRLWKADEFWRHAHPEQFIKREDDEHR